MAKSLPYFKFYCSEWNDGDITLEDMKTQGVFINICSYYWSQECNISFIKLQKRFKTFKKQIENLKKMKIIFIKDEKVVIKFLDKQWTERECAKQKNRENGLKGGRPKITETKPNGLISANPNITNKEEEEIRRRGDNIKEVKESCFIFADFWNLYEKKGNHKTSKQRYDKIKESDRIIIKEKLPNYIKSTPDKKYRKNAEVWINQECWNDEIINFNSNHNNGEQSTLAAEKTISKPIQIIEGPNLLEDYIDGTTS